MFKNTIEVNKINAYVILKFQYYKSTLISLGPMYCSSRSEKIVIFCFGGYHKINYLLENVSFEL